MCEEKGTTSTSLSQEFMFEPQSMRKHETSSFAELLVQRGAGVDMFNDKQQTTGKCRNRPVS
jgi:hypothetical protein